jgi:N-acetylglucosaminyldiphosphoundecaprenol N-acetyl-beta-D-mannosaminyltransferase
MAGLGGSLDGFAGTAKRAPKWMIRCNLEWLYRLVKEPWRIGRMMRLPKFLWKVLLRRMKG